MLLDVPWEYGGFALLIWAGLFLGVLHTIMPCEDKFIFCFYAFGVARDWKQAFRIVNFYGLGLFIMNFVIGATLSYFAALIRNTVSTYRFVWNGVAAMTLVLSGIIMLRQIKKKTYWPHTDQFQELTESISTLRARKRTAFLLGLLAGIPPCIFETAIYINAIFVSSVYGWGNGAWITFFFGIGTWIGLYPLAFIGNMSGKLSKAMKSSSIQRLQNKLKWKKKKNQNSTDEVSELDEENEAVNYSKIEYFSAYSLIGFGFIFLLLAILKKELIPIDDVSYVPWPFNDDNFHIFWIIFFIVLAIAFVVIFLILWLKNRSYTKSINEQKIKL